MQIIVQRALILAFEIPTGSILILRVKLLFGVVGQSLIVNHGLQLGLGGLKVVEAPVEGL